MPRRLAATVADGELMLLHQGAAAFTLWTGQKAPLELMQEQLAEARAGGLRSAEGEPTRRRARRPDAAVRAARRADGRADDRRPRPDVATDGGAAIRWRAFRFLTAGESHGPALGATVEGVPAGLALTEDDLAVDLARRQRGYGRGARAGDRAGPGRDPRRGPPRR